MAMFKYSSKNMNEREIFQRGSNLNQQKTFRMSTGKQATIYNNSCSCTTIVTEEINEKRSINDSREHTSTKFVSRKNISYRQKLL